jgi:hypothetical protein
VAKALGDLDAKLDALYAAPLAEFVAARNALAKELAAAGRKEDAARVKTLAKPSAAAWAVNQVAHAEPRLVDALVSAGDRLRGKPPDVKAAMAGRREAVNAAAKAAERALEKSGRAVAPDVSRRISATLEAIATFGSAPGAPAAGRLTEDVPAPGFDEIASLGLLGKPLRAAPRPDPSPPAPARPLRAQPPRAPSGRTSRRDLARERALADKRRRDDARRAATLRKKATSSRARLAAAERALEGARRARAALEEKLARAAAEEKRLEGAVSGAREELRTAEEALGGAGAPVTPPREAP